jgi:hypothetical protein
MTKRKSKGDTQPRLAQPEMDRMIARLRELFPHLGVEQAPPYEDYGLWCNIFIKEDEDESILYTDVLAGGHDSGLAGCGGPTEKGGLAIVGERWCASIGDCDEILTDDLEEAVAFLVQGVARNLTEEASLRRRAADRLDVLLAGIKMP